MPASRTLSRARTSILAAASLAVTGLAFLTPAAQAASATLVINEVYVNGGSAGATYTNKYVELRNRTGASIDLAGTSVQYRAPGSSGNATSTITLSGTVPGNGYFVLVGASNGTNGSAVPHQGQVAGGFNPGGAGGTIALVQGTTPVDPGSAPAVVDKLGYGTSNTPEGGASGSGPTGNTVTKVLGRSGGSVDTDVNSADFAAQDPTPGAANPGGGTSALTLTNPGAQSSEVDRAVTGPTLTAAGGTAPYSFSATGLPTGITVGASSGTFTGTPTATGSFSATVTVRDSAAATDSTSFTWTITESTAPVAIADIQGTSDTSPRAGQTVTTQGVVTASYPTGGINGFYLQTPGPDTLNASDAIFVYGGSTGFSTYPAVGESIRVRGAVSEFQGLTEITATQSGLTPVASLGTVTPKTVVPGTDCTTSGSACLTGVALDTAREVAEGEAFQPTAAWTATDVYDGAPYYSNGTNGSSFFGEIGLAANSDEPLVAPTELYDVQGEAAAIADRTAYNNAHRIILDDGSSTNYTSTTGQPFPWLTKTHVVRVGATVTFPAPVVLTYGFNAWRIQPSTQVVGAPSGTQPQFEQTRAANLTPEDVGGDLQLATFNVLNFFPTTGEEYVASGLGSCTYFTDRAGARTTTRACGSPSSSSGNGPRGAANDTNLQRQRDKIVAAITASGADIVSLEELENSVVFGKDRDFAISALVDALNAEAGAGTWAFVPSPPASELPAVSDQDVIRTGFVYRPGTVAPVGASDVLADQSSGSGTFANAREPLAQAFKKVGTPDTSAIAVVVNHFKSKGSGVDDGTGQGNANPDRVAQAQALLTFADQFKSARALSRVFLVGDFNAYSHEDPIQVLEDGGYTSLDSTFDPNEETYNFDGQVGSLDHVLANGPALSDVNAADVWAINGNESVYYEYGRINSNVTDLYDDGPFRSSDHSPEIVGINVSVQKTATTTTADDSTVDEGSDAQVSVSVAAASGSAVPTGTVTLTQGGNPVGSGTLDADGAITITAETSGLADGTYPVTATYEGDASFDGSTDALTLTVASRTAQVQILATNDFHGRIQNDPSSAAAGAGVLAGAVKQLRGQNPNTVFAAAGDLIGASTFESFIAHDKPTIDALNSAGLEVSAVGNHEFDQGYDDLVNRVMADYDAEDNPYGGAGWAYLGANVRFKASGDPALDGTWIKDMGGVQVGFVGAVTEHLPELVSPAGISDLEVTDIVAATNAAADDLEAEGADIVVLLVHEGAPSTDCATMDDDPTSDFGSIVTGVDDNVDVIVSGHTHLAYNCSFPVAGWSGRPVTERPVVSAGQYGAALNQLVFDVDRRTGEVQAKTQQILSLKTGQSANYPVDQPTQQIVNTAVAQAEVLGARELGQIAAPFKRGYLANGTTENRGAESTVGNLVADAQRWATRSTTTGSAQLAFMNPGGLRADLLGNDPAADDPGRPLTYRQAATVQPFANTLVNMTLTGAQIKQVLEQQWQPAGSSRPFLKLGISKGFTYTYDPSAPAGNRITRMWLNGSPVGPAVTYSVTVNSFLAAGGDNFTAFAGGTRKRDTGQTDLQGMVDYLAEFADVEAGDAPLPVDYSQRAVGVTYPAGAPAAYRAGQHVLFDVSSFSMTNASDLKDTRVRVERDGGIVLGTFALDNAAQTALPGYDEVGKAAIDVTVPDGIVGTMTLTLVGTTTGTRVSVPVTVAKRVSTLTADDTSTEWGVGARVPVRVTGGARVPAGTVRVLDGATAVGSVRLAADGTGFVTLPATRFQPGQHTLRAEYSGDSVYESSVDSFVLTVAKAQPVLAAPDLTVPYGAEKTLTVTMKGIAPIVPTGPVTVSLGGNQLGSAPVVNGVAKVKLPSRSLPVGTHTVTVAYAGDDKLRAASTTSTVTVTKSASTTTGKTTPAKPRVYDPVVLGVTVTGANGVAATGQVRIAVQGGPTITADLVDGKLRADLGSFATEGARTVTIDYLGSAVLDPSTRTVTVTVRP